MNIEIWQHRCSQLEFIRTCNKKSHNLAPPPSKKFHYERTKWSTDEEPWPCHTHHLRTKTDIRYSYYCLHPTLIQRTCATPTLIDTLRQLIVLTHARARAHTHTHTHTHTYQDPCYAWVSWYRSRGGDGWASCLHLFIWKLGLAEKRERERERKRGRMRVSE